MYTCPPVHTQLTCNRFCFITHQLTLCLRISPSSLLRGGLNLAADATETVSHTLSPSLLKMKICALARELVRSTFIVPLSRTSAVHCCSLTFIGQCVVRKEGHVAKWLTQVTELLWEEETDEKQWKRRGLNREITMSQEKPIIFVIGGPGCGKGTQCAKIVEK